MGILSFEIPKKIKSSKEHNKKYSSDSGILGTYVPNMSNEDKERWKAKHIKGKDERIEIRKTFHGVQMLIVVYKEKRETISDDWRDKHNDHGDVLMSMNGKLDLNHVEFNMINFAVKEAVEILNPVEIKVDDPVLLPFDEIGVVIKINNLLWGFPYEVQIIKSNGFNDIGVITQFKREQLIKM